MILIRTTFVDEKRRLDVRSSSQNKRISWEEAASCFSLLQFAFKSNPFNPIGELFRLSFVRHTLYASFLPVQLSFLMTLTQCLVGSSRQALCRCARKQTRKFMAFTRAAGIASWDPTLGHTWETTRQQRRTDCRHTHICPYKHSVPVSTVLFEIESLSDCVDLFLRICRVKA